MKEKNAETVVRLRTSQLADRSGSVPASTLSVEPPTGIRASIFPQITQTCEYMNPQVCRVLTSWDHSQVPLVLMAHSQVEGSIVDKFLYLRLSSYLINGFKHLYFTDVLTLVGITPLVIIPSIVVIIITFTLALALAVTAVVIAAVLAIILFLLGEVINKLLEVSNMRLVWRRQRVNNS